MLTIPQAQGVLNVTYPSAQRHVERLVQAGSQAGILHLVSDASYGKAYIAQEIVNLVADKDEPG